LPEKFFYVLGSLLQLLLVVYLVHHGPEVEAGGPKNVPKIKILQLKKMLDDGQL